MVRVEPGASTLLRFARPRGWRTAGPPAPVVGASLLAIPLDGPQGDRTLLEPLDASQRLRMLPRTLDGSVLATRRGMATLHVGGSREAHKILLQPSRSISVGGSLARASTAERIAVPLLHEGDDIPATPSW
jgi:hypothetical protein